MVVVCETERCCEEMIGRRRESPGRQLDQDQSAGAIPRTDCLLHRIEAQSNSPLGALQLGDARSPAYSSWNGLTSHYSHVLSRCSIGGDVS